MTFASIAAVLASLPRARAKSLIWRELTTASVSPAPARAAATVVSKPPVASSTINATSSALVQQQETAGADREHSPGRSRSALLCATRRARHRGVTQTKRPPANLGAVRAFRRRSQAARSPDKAGPSVAPSACPAQEENASARTANTTCKRFRPLGSERPALSIKGGALLSSGGVYFILRP